MARKLCILLDEPYLDDDACHCSCVGVKDHMYVKILRHSADWSKKRMQSQEYSHQRNSVSYEASRCEQLEGQLGFVVLLRSSRRVCCFARSEMERDITMQLAAEN